MQSRFGDEGTTYKSAEHVDHGSGCNCLWGIEIGGLLFGRAGEIDCGATLNGVQGWCTNVNGAGAVSVERGRAECWENG
jgi:hypothetical protein